MPEDKANAKPASKSAKVDGRTAVLEKIAAMPDHDRAMAERFLSIVERVAPTLKPRLWYNMPAFAKDGQVLCFFQSAAQFQSRYATFGFEQIAELDEGNMWPTAYALTELGDDEEERIEELLRRAMGL